MRQLMTQLGQYPPDVETSLQRHRRLFCARFGNCITAACISALELWRTPTNISDFACILHIRPRPHREAGARFTLHDFQVVPRQIWVDAMTRTSARGKALLEQHEAERRKIRMTTNGGSDYLTIALWIRNEGEHKIEGETADEIGFAPQLVPWNLVDEPIFKRLDWYTTLQRQIELDIPHRPLPLSY
jgi:hypothetical protein